MIKSRLSDGREQEDTQLSSDSSQQLALTYLADQNHVRNRKPSGAVSDDMSPGALPGLVQDSAPSPHQERKNTSGQRQDKMPCVSALVKEILPVQAPSRASQVPTSGNPPGKNKSSAKDEIQFDHKSMAKGKAKAKAKAKPRQMRSRSHQSKPRPKQSPRRKQLPRQQRQFQQREKPQWEMRNPIRDRQFLELVILPGRTGDHGRTMQQQPKQNLKDHQAKRPKMQVKQRMQLLSKRGIFGTQNMVLLNCWQN